MEAVARRLAAVPLWLWGAVLTILGAVLRFDIVRDVSLWIDDGYTLAAIRMSFGEVFAERLRQGHLPWFFLAFKAWADVVGTSLVALRLPSLLATLALVPLSGWVANRLAGRPAAVLAMAVAAAHGTLVRYAGEFRMYSWMALAGGLLLVAALALREQPTRGRAVALAAAHLTLLQLHVGAVLWTLPFFVALAVLLRRKAPGLVGLAFAVPLLISIPVYTALAGRLSGVEYEKFQREVPLRELLDMLFELSAGIGQVTDLWKMLVVLGGFAGCVWVWHRRGAGAVGLFLLVVGWVPSILTWTLTQAGVHVFGEPRYHIMSTVPLLVLLVGALIHFPWARRGHLLAASLVAIFCLYVTGAEMGERTKKLLRGDGIGLNTLVEEVESQAPPDAVIVVTTDGPVMELVRFYLGDQTSHPTVGISRRFTAEERGRMLSEAVKSDKDLVVFSYKTLDSAVDEHAATMGPWATIHRLRRNEPRAVWYER